MTTKKGRNQKLIGTKQRKSEKRKKQKEKKQELKKTKTNTHTQRE